MLSHEIKLLAKISDDALARTIFKRLHSDYPEHLPLLLAELKRLTSLKVGYL